MSRVEEELKTLFHLGKRWKAVILLDEADVVMTRRSSHELERNAIVAGEIPRMPSFSIHVQYELTWTNFTVWLRMLGVL